MQKTFLAIFVVILAFVLGGLVVENHHLYKTKPLVIQTTSKDTAELSKDVLQNPEHVYKQYAQSVVTIRSQFKNSDLESQGSGFVIDKEGYIVTNLHVLLLDPTSTKPTTASQIFLDFLDGTHAKATLIGSDPNSDLALLKVNPAGLHLVAVVIRTTKLHPGQPVLAIGAPFGESGSVTLGVVSAVNRSISSLVGNFTINNAIQTDAAVNHGNSGGPLLDLDGQVVGINTQIRSETNGNEGVAYAIPSELLVNLLPRLKSGTIPAYAYLGISTVSITQQTHDILHLPVDHGLLVQTVADTSPAKQAKIKAPIAAQIFFGNPIGVGGDILLTANGKDLIRPEDLVQVVTALAPGDTLHLRVMNSDGKLRNKNIRLAAR